MKDKEIIQQATEQINKLLAQYEKKIRDCERTIEEQRRGLRIARTNECMDHEVPLLRKEVGITQARLKSYIQAKYDIDSLLDYV